MLSPVPRRRRKTNPEGGSAPWMLTYSDMVTLLLTFFILLFAMSAIDVERFRVTILSIQSSLFGHTCLLYTSSAMCWKILSRERI